MIDEYDTEIKNNNSIIQIMKRGGLTEVTILKRINVGDIIKKLEHGDPVEYDRIFVENCLDLRNINLPLEKINRTREEIALGLSEDAKVIGSRIKITNSKIKAVDFTNIIFTNLVNLDGTEFLESTDFSGAYFCCPTLFRDATHFHTWFKGVRFCKEVHFDKAVFKKHVDFRGATFEENANFDNAKFGDNIDYHTIIKFCQRTKFRGEVTFNNAIFNGLADFRNSEFNRANFRKAKFSIEAYFEGSTFTGHTDFIQSKFLGASNFKDITFSGVTFMEARFERKSEFDGTFFKDIVSFMDAKFNGDSLSFKDVTFGSPKDQEDACAKAKKLLDNNGKRDEADYHFYREMEARRKQKGVDYKYFDYESLLFTNGMQIEEIGSRELRDFWKFIRYNLIEYFFFQVIFGYGVHPFRLLGWWIFLGLIFAGIYGIGNGVNDAATGLPLTDPLEYLRFGVTVAVIPGFAGFAGDKPTGIYLVIATLEAIFGAFMWGAFVTMFNRKFMR